jgi:hypothetical protein
VTKLTATDEALIERLLAAADLDRVDRLDLAAWRWPGWMTPPPTSW